MSPPLSSPTVQRLADVPPQPWRNGGGQTHELLAWVPNGGATPAPWVLRLSVAHITGDGPFSAWPGVTRHFAVLSGGGVRLAWPDGRVRVLQAGEPLVSFDGEDAPMATLSAGATQDLNLMLSCGWVGGGVVLQPGVPWCAPAAARWLGLYAHAAGPWALGILQGRLDGPGLVWAAVRGPEAVCLGWGEGGRPGLAYALWAAPDSALGDPVWAPAARTQA